MREELLANMFCKTRKGGGGWVLSDRAKKVLSSLTLFNIAVHNSLRSIIIEARRGWRRGALWPQQDSPYNNTTRCTVRFPPLIPFTAWWLFIPHIHLDALGLVFKCWSIQSRKQHFLVSKKWKCSPISVLCDAPFQWVGLGGWVRQSGNKNLKKCSGVQASCKILFQRYSLMGHLRKYINAETNKCK